MASVSSLPEAPSLAAADHASVAPGIQPGALFVSLGPLAIDAFHTTLSNLALAFPDRSIAVASPDAASDAISPASNLQLLTYTPAAPSPGSWVLTAADYVNTFKLMQEQKASLCLMLGADAHTLPVQAIRALGEGALSSTDLTTPRYELGPRDGLVNSAILYPVTRALFGTRPRYPLAIDLGISFRMAERLAAAAQKYTAANQGEALIWPVAEAAAAGFSLAEVEAGPRTLPPPDVADLNALLAQVAGSLFADVDAKAAFWQRSRIAYSPRAASDRAATFADAGAPSLDTPTAPDVQPMLDSFRLAYSNLHEIWSLVLPPNSLLGLKKLSLMPPASFRMTDALWVRIVYDFILAFRLRTLNRGHLLGALTPLYLAWVASHLLLTSSTSGVSPEQHIEALAAAFELDKPYLVSRWRWPDRFNP